MSTFFDFWESLLYTLCHMSLETRARARINDGFEQMEGFDDQRRFPPAMQVNKFAIKKAFGIAGLVCSGITIEPMSQSAMAMNKGSLFVTEKVDNRWKITVNDGEMKTNSAKKKSRDDHWESFTHEFNDVIRAAVWSCILEEKRLERTQTKEFSPLVLKAFEFYDLTKCYIFLRLGDGRTLVRESK